MTGHKEDFWGRVFRVGSSLNIPQGTLLQWRQRGAVPSRRHYALNKQAHALGVALSIPELNGEAAQ